MILFEETIRNEKSGNNIKGNLLLNVPDDMAQGLIDIMKTWKVVSKSPYSYSFYDITNFTVVYWLKKENKEKLKTLLTKLK